MRLFVLFGYQKLMHFGGTVSYMAKLETPLPMAALIAGGMAFPVLNSCAK
ncbi:hypothetical protein [Rosenbergiella nectarea]|nr:hypothetical protein [Rosenbergiella nectarea]MBT0730461.1 hypothetical protein [Rosenbergiella nectarea subsp. apis]